MKRREGDRDVVIPEAAAEEPPQDPVEDDESDRQRRRDEALRWMRVSAGGAER